MCDYSGALVLNISKNQKNASIFEINGLFTNYLLTLRTLKRTVSVFFVSVGMTIVGIGAGKFLATFHTPFEAIWQGFVYHHMFT